MTDEHAIYKIATHVKVLLERNHDNEDIREAIVDVATGHLNLPVWNDVFKNDSDMLNRFSKAAQE